MNEIIKSAIEATQKHLPDHYATLLGERPAGSKWGREFTEDDFGREWVNETENVDDELRIPGCVYFCLSPSEVERAFPDRSLGAIPLNQLESEEYSNIRIRNGAHGVELVYEGKLDDVDGIDPEAWIILGDEKVGNKNVLVVWTAHPGPLMKPLPSDSFKDFFEKPFAVKLP